MSWAVGFDSNWNRFIGYGVPAFCDHPGCTEKIDRGVAHVCEGRENDNGCGLHFCADHLGFYPQFCMRCFAVEDGDESARPFSPKGEHPEWAHHVLTDASWQHWREENPSEVRALLDRLMELALPPAVTGRDAAIEAAHDRRRPRYRKMNVATKKKGKTR